MLATSFSTFCSLVCRLTCHPVTWRALSAGILVTFERFSQRICLMAWPSAAVGQAGVGPLAAEATAHWLAQLEAANDVVILKAGAYTRPLLSST